MYLEHTGHHISGLNVIYACRWLQELVGLRLRLAVMDSQLSEQSIESAATQQMLAAAQEERARLAAAGEEAAQLLAAQSTRLVHLELSSAETSTKLAETEVKVAGLQEELSEAVSIVERRENEAVQQLMTALESEQDAEEQLNSAQARTSTTIFSTNFSSPPLLVTHFLSILIIFFTVRPRF